MSNTPKTDKLAQMDFVPDGVWIKHGRELESENENLKEELRLWEEKCHELIAPHYILDPDLRASKFREALRFHPVLMAKISPVHERLTKPTPVWKKYGHPSELESH